MLYSLRNHTLYLARVRPRNITIEKIANVTGLSETWLKKFCAGQIEEPSVNKIETLYVYLTGKQLEL
jgi:transcriptional regulator with XRE-family HTH domain